MKIPNEDDIDLEKIDPNKFKPESPNPKHHKFKRYVKCDKCKGVYELSEGESLEDFVSCSCGGKLRYKYLSQPITTENGKNETLTRGIGEGRPLPDLLITSILSLFCLAMILVPSLNNLGLGKSIGSVLMIFLPGYVIIAALFPRNSDISVFQRLGMILTSSLSMILIFCIILRYKPDASLEPVIVSLMVFTLFVSLGTYIIRHGYPQKERFQLIIKNPFKGLPHAWLSITLVLLILFSVLFTVDLVVYPHSGDKFTEFYLLGPKWKAADYPYNLTTGQKANVIVGIVNHEQAPTSYHLLIKSNGTTLNDWNVTLSDNEKIYIPYNFTAGSSGNKKIEFLLYKLPNNKDVYLSTYLWVKIK